MREEFGTPRTKEERIERLIHEYVDGALNRRHLIRRLARLAGGAAAAAAVLENAGLAQVRPPANVDDIRVSENDPAIEWRDVSFPGQAGQVQGLLASPRPYQQAPRGRPDGRHRTAAGSARDSRESRAHGTHSRRDPAHGQGRLRRARDRSAVAAGRDQGVRRRYGSRPGIWPHRTDRTSRGHGVGRRLSEETAERGRGPHRRHRVLRGRRQHLLLGVQRAVAPGRRPVLWHAAEPASAGGTRDNAAAGHLLGERPGAGGDGFRGCPSRWWPPALRSAFTSTRGPITRSSTTPATFTTTPAAVDAWAKTIGFLDTHLRAPLG